MRRFLAPLAAGLALAAIPATSNALGQNEKDCLIGGAGGAVAGHFLGNHPVIGAAAGCAIGNYVSRDQALKQRKAEEQRKREVAHNHDKAVARAKRRQAEEARAERPAG